MTVPLFPVNGMEFDNENDTIAAVSTPRGTGAISVVRITGKGAFSAASRVFFPQSRFQKAEERRAIVGFIEDSGRKIDSVVAVKYCAPRSYTGEDTVEISCHGGIYITEKILELLVSAGARPAGPGEFTKRAFLNGKIDLMQAEAVQELISAKSEGAGAIALRSLRGGVSSEIRRIKESLSDILSGIAVSIDYPEYDHDEPEKEALKEKLIKAAEETGRLAASYEKGKHYINGVRIVIAGKPNVGKSTFLNAFIGRNRAIVSDIPGTTRDTIEERLEIRGIPVILTDTAGLGDAHDIIEQMGQDRTREAIKTADMIILVVDPAEGVTDEDAELLRENSDKEVILLLNKIDTTDDAKLSDIERSVSHTHVIRTSLISGKGLEKAEAAISERLWAESGIGINEKIITGLRQRELLNKANKRLEDAIMETSKGMPADIAEMEIRKAAAFLAEMLGEDIEEEIMEKIFSRFCIGK